MIPTRNAKYPSLLFMLLITLSCKGILSSGSSSQPVELRYAATVPGAVLAQHGSHLYILGGHDENGSVTDYVGMIPLGPDGVPGEVNWQTQSPIPEPREGAASFTIGGLLYLVGGRDQRGVPRSDIFYTGINSSTGRLGFGSDARWERNSVSLPHGLYDMAWVIQEGRIILVGGTTPAGVTDTIIHARVYADGRVGYWYDATRRLRIPRTGAAAVIRDSGDAVSLVVAGGIHGSGGYLLDQIETFGVGDDCRLSSGPDDALPIAVARPILLTDQADLIAGGGDAGSGETSRWYRRVSPGSWQAIGNAPPTGSTGPSRARAGGAITYISISDGGAGTLRSTLLSIAPERPRLHPSSGIVPSGTTMQIIAEPGTVARYRIVAGGTEAGGVSVSDPVWEPGLSVQGEMSVAIRAFAPNGAASPTTRHRYRSRSTGLLLHADRLVVQPEIPSELSLVSPGWYFFDTNGDPLGIFTAAEHNARISAFEPDYYTPVLDTSGIAILEMGRGPSDPAIARFPAGRFFILVESSVSSPDPVGIALYRM